MKKEKDIPIKKIDIPVKEDFKPFLSKGHIFMQQKNVIWKINLKPIGVYVRGLWCIYVNWFNWKFNNPCICPEIFLRGEKIYGYK
jgi:hypothetical protein